MTWGLPAKPYQASACCHPPLLWHGSAGQHVHLLTWLRLLSRKSQHPARQRWTTTPIFAWTRGAAYVSALRYLPLPVWSGCHAIALVELNQCLERVKNSPRADCPPALAPTTPRRASDNRRPERRIEWDPADSRIRCREALCRIPGGTSTRGGFDNRPSSPGYRTWPYLLPRGRPGHELWTCTRPQGRRLPCGPERAVPRRRPPPTNAACSSRQWRPCPGPQWNRHMTFRRIAACGQHSRLSDRVASLSGFYSAPRTTPPCAL